MPPLNTFQDFNFNRNGNLTNRSFMDTTLDDSRFTDLAQPITAPEFPTYRTPTLDLGRVAGLTQEFASPTIRAGRNALRTTLSGGSRINPVARAYQTRGAIEGFGDTVEKAVGGARHPAYSLANQELGLTIDELKNKQAGQWRQTLMDYEGKVRTRDLMLAERKRNLIQEEENRRRLEDRIWSVEDRNIQAVNSRKPSLGDFQPFGGISHQEAIDKQRRDLDIRDRENSANTTVYGNKVEYPVYPTAKPDDNWELDGGEGSIKINGVDYSNQ